MMSSALLILILSATLQHSATRELHDCYNTKCQGRGASRDLYIKCYNRINYCNYTSIGSPVCQRAPNSPSREGVGCPDGGKYICKADIKTGVAWCDRVHMGAANYIYTLVAVAGAMLSLLIAYTVYRFYRNYKKEGEVGRYSTLADDL